MICNKCGREFPDSLPQPIKCFCHGSKKKNPNFVNKTVRTEDFLRKLWEELHTFQFTNPRDTEKWFHKWCNRIPCGSCKGHWLMIVRQNPPVFSSKEGFFKWGVEAHNIVNKRLEKRVFSLEEAKTIWNYS